VLLSPEDGAQIAEDAYANLRWGWDGELEKDEYFDVRFWKNGAPHYGVAWTKEGSHAVRGEPGITYFWAIAVIRGQDGQMLEQLSPESRARRLFWPTPTPTPDVEGPPAPLPLEPEDGAILSCRPSVTLVWQPVYDPSGISAYWGKLEIEVTEDTWQSGGWGPVSENKKVVDVSCGRSYRWRVWAVDGAGNMGNWSNLSYFSVEAVAPPTIMCGATGGRTP